MKLPILIAICLVMSVANEMNYAGMTTSIPLRSRPFRSSRCSPVIGWIRRGS